MSIAMPLRNSNRQVQVKDVDNGSHHPACPGPQASVPQSERRDYLLRQIGTRIVKSGTPMDKNAIYRVPYAACNKALKSAHLTKRVCTLPKEAEAIPLPSARTASINSPSKSTTTLVSPSPAAGHGRDAVAPSMTPNPTAVSGYQRGGAGQKTNRVAPTKSPAPPANQQSAPNRTSMSQSPMPQTRHTSPAPSSTYETAYGGTSTANSSKFHTPVPGPSTPTPPARQPTQPPASRTSSPPGGRRPSGATPPPSTGNTGQTTTSVPSVETKVIKNNRGNPVHTYKIRPPPKQPGGPFAYTFPNYPAPPATAGRGQGPSTRGTGTDQPAMASRRGRSAGRGRGQ